MICVVLYCRGNPADKALKSKFETQCNERSNVVNVLLLIACILLCISEQAQASSCEMFTLLRSDCLEPTDMMTD